MMKTIVGFSNCFFVVLSCLTLFLVSCNDDEPQPEEVPELITKTVLIFKPTEGGTSVVVEANDPDGEGPQDLEPSSVIALDAATTYTLTIDFYNTLVDEGEEGYNITEEVKEEGDEHQLFFVWNPTALIDGELVYNDEDDNGLPIGLSTSFSTGSAAQNGSLRVVLKHQPGIKSANSGINDGESDVDVAFDVTLQ